MNRYFVCSDIHGFYDEFKAALDKNNFNINDTSHKIIICGDLFDRGKQAKELLEFLLSIPEDRLIIVRGNHEDLIEDCLQELGDSDRHKYIGTISSHHISNKTLDTIAQLTNISEVTLAYGSYSYKKIKEDMKPYFNLINRSVNYYELDKYIFVHGWIPQGISYENLSKVGQYD